MKKHWILLTALLATSFAGAMADDFEDDIYFDPSKAKKQTNAKVRSNYIKDFDQQDVDAYNRRGQYYVSPVDTIGDYVSNGEDFVYTQKIQKFYNPTIVVDNADLLEAVLANSYGNVDVVYNIDGPVFSSLYSPWNTWTSVYYAPGWGWNVGWNSPYWGPSFSIGWGSTWNYGWGPAWSYGWGPVWSYGWGGPAWSYGWGGPWGGYVPPHHHRPYPPRPVHYAQWTPGRNSVNRPGNYSGAYNYAGHVGGTRPGYSTARPGSVTTRPGSGLHSVASSTRPTGNSIGGNRGLTRRPEGTSSSSVTRPTTSGVRPNVSTRPTTTTRPSVSTRPTTTTTRPTTTTTRPTTSTTRPSTSVTRPSSSSSSFSRPSGSSSGRGSSSGHSSGGSRGSSGGRGGRR